MSNWKNILSSKAHYGTFVGKDPSDENNYYEFFAGPDFRSDRVRSLSIAKARRALEVLRSTKVTFKQRSIQSRASPK